MQNPNDSSPTDPHTLTLFQEEMARAAAMPDLTAPGAALWPRFAGYYQGLAHLPRKTRRALQRRWRRSLGGLALLCALGQTPALAATISVGASCSLVDAITTANNDAPAGGCPAGRGADTVVLPQGSFQPLTALASFGFSALRVTSAIFIDGNGSTIARDPAATVERFGILEVDRGGNLTLVETTISGGIDHGVKNNSFGILTIANSTISGNRGVGVDNRGTLVMTNSTISGNSVGGVDNSNTATITNSTISGNSGSSSGGGVNNRSFLTLTDSTVSGNSAAFGGGLSSCGSTKLTRSLVSGNTAATRGAEIFDRGAGLVGGPCGSVIADLYNLFGHDGVAGVDGFTPGGDRPRGAVPAFRYPQPHARRQRRPHEDPRAHSRQSCRRRGPGT